MNENEEDQLWHLLGKAKETKVSPFFSRNVLRAVRQMEQERSAPFAWLLWAQRATIGAAAALAVFAFIHTGHRHNEAESTALLTQQIVNNPDFDVIEDLDELLAYENSSIWLDESTN